MGVMCASLGLLIAANLADRTPHHEMFIQKGVPPRYCLEFRVTPTIRAPDGSIAWKWEGESPYDAANLVIDVAFALLVSITLALASERFVFSRWRRGSCPSPLSGRDHPQ
jgi:hypothetical protein